MRGLISAEQHGGQIERRIIRVRGVVQGVGFRPFVFRLARDLDLSGLVRNDAEGVEIEAQGLPGNISALLARLYGEAPMLARVDSVDSALVEVDPLDRGFTIGSSKGGPVSTIIGHDSTVCRDCLVELFDPSNRRWRHPFINCTQCGPRYTLTRALPYDRSTTSMADFEQCLACQEEYDTPPNRRFHAEPNACPECG
ncbi:MAG: acylphosphatase, partial [Rhodocyclaceae bacterium]|nr:acylphosphatase [Rhodocyclaceae bacterium]